MGVARSTTGSVLGPWVQQDEPLWARNGGHGMIFTDSWVTRSSCSTGRTRRPTNESRS